jgi:hypothetical protein
MKIQKNEKSAPIGSNIPTVQKLKTDFEKKLNFENAKVFKEIFGVKTSGNKLTQK